MEAYELMDLALNSQLRVDANWLFFLTVNSSLVAGIVFVERKFSHFEKLVAITIYLAVIWLNYFTLSNSMRILSGIYADLSKAQFAPETLGFEVLSEFNAISNNLILENQWLVVVVYLVGASLSISSIVFCEKVSIK